MKLKLKNFGSVLTSRQDGREAFLAIQPILKDLSKKDVLIIDFKNIGSLSPSWAEEFFIPLLKTYKKSFVFENVDNPSAKMTLSFLEKINSVKFNIK